MKTLIENRITELRAEKKQTLLRYQQEKNENERDILSAVNTRLSMEIKFLNELSQAAVSG